MLRFIFKIYENKYINNNIKSKKILEESINLLLFKISGKLENGM